MPRTLVSRIWLPPNICQWRWDLHKVRIGMICFFWPSIKCHVYVSAPRYWLQQKNWLELTAGRTSIDFGGKSRIINQSDLNPQSIQSLHPSIRKRTPRTHTNADAHTHTHTNIIITTKTRKCLSTIATTYCSDSIFPWKGKGPDFACEAISSDALWREFTSFTLARRGKSWWWQLECTLDPTWVAFFQRVVSMILCLFSRNILFHKTSLGDACKHQRLGCLRWKLRIVAIENPQDIIVASQLLGIWCMERMVVMLEVSGRDHHNAQEFVSGIYHIYIYIYYILHCI